MDVLLQRASVTTKQEDEMPTTRTHLLVAKKDLTLILTELFSTRPYDIPLMSNLVLSRISPPVINKHTGFLSDIKLVQYKKDRPKKQCEDNIIYLVDSDAPFVMTNTNPRDVIYPTSVPVYAVTDILKSDFQQKYTTYALNRTKYRGLISINVPVLLNQVSTPFVTQAAAFANRYTQVANIIPTDALRFKNARAFESVKLDWDLTVDYSKLTKLKNLKHFYPLQNVARKKTTDILLDSPLGGRVIMELLWHNDSNTLVKILDRFRVDRTKLLLELASRQTAIRETTILRFVELLLSAKRVEKIHELMNTNKKPIIKLLTAKEINSIREYIEAARKEQQSLLNSSCVPFLSWRKRWVNESEKHLLISNLWTKFNKAFEFNEDTNQYVYYSDTKGCYAVNALCIHEREMYVDNISTTDVADRYGDFSKADTFANIYCRFCYRKITEQMDDKLDFTGENGKLYIERQTVKHQNIKNPNFVLSYIYTILPLFTPVLGLSAPTYYAMISKRLGEKHLNIEETQADEDTREVQENYWSIVISAALMAKLMIDKKTHPVSQTQVKTPKEAVGYIIAALSDYLIIDSNNEKAFKKDVLAEAERVNTAELDMKSKLSAVISKSILTQLRSKIFDKAIYKKPKAITPKTLVAWTNYRLGELVNGKSFPNVPPADESYAAFNEIAVAVTGPTIHLEKAIEPAIKKLAPFTKIVYETTGTYPGKLAPLEIINGLNGLEGGDVAFVLLKQTNVDLSKLLSDAKWKTRFNTETFKPPPIKPSGVSKLIPVSNNSRLNNQLMHDVILKRRNAEFKKLGKFKAPDLTSLKKKVLTPLREHKIINNTSDASIIENKINSYWRIESGKLSARGVRFMADAAKLIVVKLNEKTAVQQVADLNWALHSIGETETKLPLAKWYIIYWFEISIAAGVSTPKTTIRILKDFFETVDRQNELRTTYFENNWVHIREEKEIEMMRRGGTYLQKIRNESYAVQSLEEVDAYTANPGVDIDDLEIEDDLAGNETVSDIFN